MSANFCPRCGSALTAKPDGGRERPTCPDESCGFIDFGNFSIGCGGVVMRDGNALLVQRGWDPGRGSWQIPGGYVEHDEDIVQAVEREVLEETGIEARVRDAIGFRHSVGGSIGGPSTNVYVVFRLDQLGGEVRYDDDEVTDAGFFSLEALANMERVQNLSIWAIQKAMESEPDSGFHPQTGTASMNRPGWLLFGLRGADGRPY